MHFEALEPRRHLTVIDLGGVYPAALDLPRINVALRRTPTGAPITVPDFGGLYNFDLNGVPFYSSFLDTGASGVLLTNLAREYWHINPLAAPDGSGDVVYSDVGVGGTDDFNVSEPLYISLANFNNPDVTDADDPSDLSPYTFTTGRINTQLSMPLGDNDIDPLGDIASIIGMPAMQNKVVVFDPRPLNVLNSGDYMKTYIYNPGTPPHPQTDSTDPGIPNTQYSIALSYASFDRFSTVTPGNATRPVTAANPFIGPNPLHAFDPTIPAGNNPPIDLTFAGQNTHGSFLLDSGGSVSILSRARAAELGIDYVDGTYGTDNAALAGIPTSDQFKLAIGGVGGQQTFAGVYLDTMDIPTTGGDKLRVTGAPFLIGDISLEDPVTHAPFTLDGIFGMNNLVASASVEYDPTTGDPTLGDQAENAFDYIVFDQPNGLLKLQPGVRTIEPHVNDQIFDVDVAPHAFYFQFSRNVAGSLSLDDLVFQNLTTNTTFTNAQLHLDYEPLLYTATLKFPTQVGQILTDGNYRITVKHAGIQDVNGVNMTADYVYTFSFLTGDVNADRMVNSIDFNSLAAHYGQEDGEVDPVGFSHGDFNYDGTVDTLDFAKLIAQFGKTLPVPAASLPSNRLSALPAGVKSTFSALRISSPGLFNLEKDDLHDVAA